MPIGDALQTAAVDGHTAVTVEVLYFQGCPHAADALALVHRCVQHLQLDVAVSVRIGDHASPSVLVNGRDVMGDVVTHGPACRHDVPTEQRVLDALQAAMRGDAP